MLTRAVTCGVLNGAGDIFSQLCVEQQAFDAKRCLSFTLLGLLLVGPILATWYGNLGKIVTATGIAGTLQSLLLDQCVFAPSFIAAFMSAITIAEGKSDQVVRKLKQDWPETIKVNWVLWIPAQFINFKFVPPNLTMLAVNITALVWNVYMSYQSHKVLEPHAGST
ncbi:hypothetical protein DUNSADRAFT_496 [Dunaliella salina]|uniref:Uncharacterized protein n=1 Tax=Dunaliella salina TaxID=3046 RepID=A0ABQ7FYU2_DUNSA|nr:hypothetical protein DUNSADRAFT_496 [Dunaliella salina]|eukprot:KAF5827527.1 hypothetical protein DUNSADRAFT_496 [Dunaliella salina]